jgi:galactokinase
MLDYWCVVQALAHKYVHAIEGIAAAAVTAIERADPAGLARQMTLAQEAFDAGCLPNCPSQLASPRLHALMADTEVRALCLVVKGVGSQGDGSAQILCSSMEKQEQVSGVLAVGLSRNYVPVLSSSALHFVSAFCWCRCCRL